MLVTKRLDTPNAKTRGAAAGITELATQTVPAQLPKTIYMCPGIYCYTSYKQRATTAYMVQSASKDKTCTRAMPGQGFLAL